jgi:hypothetical protein
VRPCRLDEPDNQQANADQPINRRAANVQLRRDSVAPGVFTCARSMDSIRPLAAAVPVSIGRSVAFSAAPRPRTFRSMSGKSHQADVLECDLEMPSGMPSRNSSRRPKPLFVASSQQSGHGAHHPRCQAWLEICASSHQPRERDSDIAPKT